LLAETVVSNNFFDLDSTYGEEKQGNLAIVIGIFWDTGAYRSEDSQTIFDWDKKTSPYKLRQFEKNAQRTHQLG